VKSNSSNSGVCLFNCFITARSLSQRKEFDLSLLITHSLVSDKRQTKLALSSKKLLAFISHGFLQKEEKNIGKSAVSGREHKTACV
jgi:hypothetical protein